MPYFNATAWLEHQGEAPTGSAYGYAAPDRFHVSADRGNVEVPRTSACSQPAPYERALPFRSHVKRQQPHPQHCAWWRGSEYSIAFPNRPMAYADNESGRQCITYWHCCQRNDCQAGQSPRHFDQSRAPCCDSFLQHQRINYACASPVTLEPYDCFIFRVHKAYDVPD